MAIYTYRRYVPLHEYVRYMWGHVRGCLCYCCPCCSAPAEWRRTSREGQSSTFHPLEAFPFPSKFNNCQITFSEVCGEVVCYSSTPKLSLRSWIQKQRTWFSSQPLLCCWEVTPPQSGLLHRTERKSESVFSVRQQYSCFISVANCLFSSSKPQHFYLKGIQDELMFAHNICHIPSLSFSEPKCQELSPPIITITSYISDAKMNYWNKILIKLEVSQQFDL